MNNDRSSGGSIRLKESRESTPRKARRGRREGEALEGGGARERGEGGMGGGDQQQ